MKNIYSDIVKSVENSEKLLAILIDPDKFNVSQAQKALSRLTKNVSFIFVGGSEVEAFHTEKTVKKIKTFSSLPVILFPGDHSQITETADSILFLSLLSGRNPEFLIEQHIKSVKYLRNSSLEIIPTGYILIDGGKNCAVHRVSNTTPIPQTDVELIVETALAGQFSGKKLIYLEAGSGAVYPVEPKIISEVKKAISIPLIVGGGIRNSEKMDELFNAGADIIVVGTAFENGSF